jgi:hypothetical protein
MFLYAYGGLMTLRKTQSKFATMVAKLIMFANDNGYDVTLGDAYRDPRAFGAQGECKAYGHKVSAHKQRLAIDLNLFKDDVFLRSTKDHEPIGLYWESIGGTWGGRFNDGNHYSVEMYGVK